MRSSSGKFILMLLIFNLTIYILLYSDVVLVSGKEFNNNTSNIFPQSPIMKTEKYKSRVNAIFANDTFLSVNKNDNRKLINLLSIISYKPAIGEYCKSEFYDSIATVSNDNSTEISDVDFATDSILVSIKYEFSEINKEWYITDFPEANIESIRDLTYVEDYIPGVNYYTTENFHQILKFTLVDKTVEGVLEAINQLQSNPYVGYATPNDKIYGESNESNEPEVVGDLYGNTSIITHDINSTIDSTDNSTAISDVDFATDSILVSIKHEFSEINKEWYITDFPEANIESIKDLTYVEDYIPGVNYYNTDNFHQILKFTLVDKTVEGVLEAINQLQSNPYVEYATPNDKIFGESDESNEPEVVGDLYGNTSIITHDINSTIDSTDNSTAISDVDFATDSILVSIKHSFSDINKEWYITDFPEANIESIKDLTYVEDYIPGINYYNTDNFHQIFKFTLVDKTVEGVLEAINQLQSNPYVEYATPNDKIYGDSDKSNETEVVGDLYGNTSIITHDINSTILSTTNTTIGDATTSNTTDTTKVAATVSNTTNTTIVAVTTSNTTDTTKVAATASNTTNTTIVAVTTSNTTDTTRVAATTSNTTDTTKVAVTTSNTTDTTRVAATTSNTTDTTKVAVTTSNTTDSTIVAATTTNTSDITKVAATTSNTTDTTKVATTTSNTTNTTKVVTTTSDTTNTTKVTMTTADTANTTKVTKTTSNTTDTTKVAATTSNTTDTTKVATTIADTANTTKITMTNSNTTDITKVAATTSNKTNTTKVAATTSNTTNTTKVVSTTADTTNTTKVAATISNTTDTTKVTMTTTNEINTTKVASITANITDTTKVTTTISNTTNTTKVVSTTANTTNVTMNTTELGYTTSEKNINTTINADPTLLVSKQAIIKQGSTVDLKSLISEAVDSDGNDLTNDVVISGEVNTSVVGAYPIIYSVTDKNGITKSARSIVSVRGDDTVLIGDNAINAHDFSLSISEAKSITKDQILAKAEVNAWNIDSGTDLTGSVQVDKTELESSIGQYRIAININFLKATFGKNSSGEDSAIVIATVYEEFGSNPNNDILPKTGENNFILKFLSN